MSIYLNIKVTNGGQNYYALGNEFITFPNPQTDESIADSNIPVGERVQAQGTLVIGGSGGAGPIIDVIIDDYGYGYDVTKMSEISAGIIIQGHFNNGTDAVVQVTSMANEEDASYGSGHGTIMALLAAGDNPAVGSNADFGPGVARSANIFSVKCADSTGVATEVRVLRGLDRIIEHRKTTSSPSILNVSFSHEEPSDQSKRYYDDIVGPRSDERDLINDNLNINNSNLRNITYKTVGGILDFKFFLGNTPE